MPARTLFVVNPCSRGGQLGRRWPALERQARGHFDEAFEVEHTRAPRDAERIAREAARAGVERVIAVGGDGTASEVVSGILGAGLQDAAQVGLLPFGTGGDLARSLGLPEDPDAGLARLTVGKTRRVDAGRVELRAADGRPKTTWFVNIASLGLSGLVTELVNAAPKALGGRVSFLIGTLRGLASYRAEPMVLRVDGEVVHRGPLMLVAVANGQWFGGGMHVAPEARLDDGLLDVVAVESASRARLVTQLPRLYRGTHIGRPEVHVFRGAQIEIDAEPGLVAVELDGEPSGSLPARVEVLPGALHWVGAEG